MAPEPITFVDTNVLVYAHDATEAVKQPIARQVLEELWARGGGAVSTQVLQEFYAVATGRQRIAMTPGAAREIVRLYSAWPVVTVDPTLIIAASALHERGSISFWDALVVEAAVIAGATQILSEDLQHGMRFGGLVVRNPFLREQT